MKHVFSLLIALSSLGILASCSSSRENSNSSSTPNTTGNGVRLIQAAEQNTPAPESRVTSTSSGAAL